MKTRKFEGKTEQEALEKVRDELGLSAIVLSIKSKPKKGFFKRLFQKPVIVVTAAYDETEAEKDRVLAAAMEATQNKQSGRSELPPLRKNIPSASDRMALSAGNAGGGVNADLPELSNRENLIQSTLSERVSLSDADLEFENKDLQIANQQQTIKRLEEILSRLTNQLEVTEQRKRDRAPSAYENSRIQMFYDSLITQGVSPEIAEIVLEDANTLSAADRQDINLLVKIVYNKIIEILGEPRVLVGQATGAGYSGSKQIVVFMGPTGVGKTTTIAKLSSILLLDYHKQVGLITADTYRIAAVEQLRTYAEIMGLNLKVIYSGDEILPGVKRLHATHDVILVDTAGRSHHNRENLKELKNMLEFIPDSNNFLVLSVTTRQEDILSIIKTYEAVADFDLIFTKLDEADSLGVLLNVCYLTGRKISYVTFGQNVPEDIEKIQPEKIAKALLGTGWNSVAGDVHGSAQREA